MHSKWILTLAVATVVLESRALARDAPAPHAELAAAAADTGGSPDTGVSPGSGASPDTGEATELASVIVTGTRQSGVTLADSPAPIQILSAQTLERVSGKPDLVTTLATLVPSLTAQTFGGDQSNQTLQVKLRGLSPNHVLILINGKRRHTTANLNVSSSPYQGGASADLNLIPVEAIDHIEVLTEGAAAQYGSDAIAGVINIILKKNAAGGELGATYGRYGDGGGSTEDIAGNIGFRPYDGSYLSFTGEVRNHGHSSRGAVDPRLINPTTYPDTNVFNAPGYPHLNQIEGDAAYHTTLVAFNAGFDLAEGIRLYSLGTWGKKTSNSYQNYRLPDRVSYTDPVTKEVTYPFPFGFTPVLAIDETDYGITGGLDGVSAGWNWDVASTYGYDHDELFTLSSSNPTLFATTGSSPTDFYDGYFKSTQWTTNIDINRDFDLGLAGPLNIAFGGEYRRETYAIGAGAPASYANGGAQAFPGFNPRDAGIHSRKNEAAYLDFAVRPVERLRLDAAGRYERYTDFGSKAVGKLTGRYDVIPEFAVRATASTGFRAPTLGEEYYTTTNVSPTSAVVQLAPNSFGARNLGLGTGLAPETSRNYSLGFVLHPLPDLIATLDAYQIDIRNRIVASGTISAAVGGKVVAPAVTQAILDNGNVLDPQVIAQGLTAVTLFTNGVDTRTRGADLVVDYTVGYGSSKVNWSIGATYNDTVARRIRVGPTALAGQQLFDPAAISNLTTAAPQYLVNLGALWTVGPLSLDVHELIYGESAQFTSDSGATLGTTTVYYASRIGVTPITNVNVTYQALQQLQLSVGALNAFNRYPNQVNGALLAAYAAAQFSFGASQYPAFSPFGFNGGYYYARALFSF